ncbi:MAG: polymer-forming cytoskeletal protein, partial [Chloroflexota bacterium]
MSKFRNLLCLAIVAASLLFPSAAFARDNTIRLLDDQVVFGGTFTLEAGDVLDGSLIVIGGVVNLEADSVVDGDIVIFGGNVTVEGQVSENLVAIGGVVMLTETAEIYGDLIAPATVVRREDGSQVYGQIIADPEGMGIQIPEVPEIPEIPEVPESPEIPELSRFDKYLDSVSDALRPIISFFWSLVRAFALAAVAVLVFLFLPKHTERVSRVVENYPVTAGGLGILTVVLSIPVTVVTSITIILIPASILIWLGLILGLSYGFIAVGSDVGRRIADGLGQEWKRPLQTAVGAFSIAFLISILGLAQWDWLASLLWIVIGGIGLGAVMMTRFGTREYSGPAPSKSASPEAFTPPEDPNGSAVVAASEAEVEEVPKAAAKPKPRPKTKA